MIDSKRTRYKVLDKCFRTPGRKYFLEDLVNACNRALLVYGKTISKDTINKDIRYIRDVFGEEALPRDNMVGHETFYRYKDPSFSIMRDLFDEEPETEKIFDDINKLLVQYKDVPEFKWLSLLVQQIQAGLQ